MSFIIIYLHKLHEFSFFYRYIITACLSITVILRHFGSVIKTNSRGSAGSFGVDISREERYNKSIKCYEILVRIRSLVDKKQITAKGPLGSTFKELQTLLMNTLD